MFYSALNVRVFCDDNLEGVVSVPFNRILKPKFDMDRLLDLIMRDPRILAMKVLRRWRAFVAKARLEKVASNSEEPTHGPSSSVDGFLALQEEGAAEEVAARIESKNKKKGKKRRRKASRGEPLLSTSAPSDVKIQIDDDDRQIRESIAARAMIKKQAGKINAKTIAQLEGAPPPAEEKGSEYENHWRIKCEYELLPLVDEPFKEFEIFTGKDEIHQSFFEKIFVQSKRAIGKVRAHFEVTKIQKKKKEEADGTPRRRARLGDNNDELDEKHEEVEMQVVIQKEPPKSLFDVERYKHRTPYVIRLYVTQCLQLISQGARNARDCDPYLVILLDGEETHKSKIFPGQIHPLVKELFEIPGVRLPSSSSTLTVQVWDDGTCLFLFVCNVVVVVVGSDCEFLLSPLFFLTHSLLSACSSSSSLQLYTSLKLPPASPS